MKSFNTNTYLKIEVMPTKKEIIDELIKKIAKTLNSTIEQAEVASDAAIDAPGRNESRYDSTKEEMSYLSDALKAKVLGMQMAIDELTNFSPPKKSEYVIVGSLVEIFMNNSNQLLFFVPSGGGYKIEVGDLSIFAVSKGAPLYSALLGRKKDQATSFNGKPIIIKSIE